MRGGGRGGQLNETLLIYVGRTGLPGGNQFMGEKDMLKRLTSLFMALCLVLLLATACGSSDSGDASDTTEDGTQKLRVAFVIPGSISDGAFGTLSYAGVQAVQEEPYIEEAVYVEGIDAATDASKAIRDYVAAGYDVVWAQSGLHSASVMEIAPEFPENVFVTLAATPEDQTFDNVWFAANECESAYYAAGALAAQTTQSKVIGVVGGRENPLYVACATAYAEGAHSVDPDVEVLTVFTGDFNDPIKAKEAAASQIQSGADVIVHFQDLGMTGVIAAAEEALAAGNQVWVIGKGVDQYDQAPDVTLTSVIFDYGAAMKNVLTEIANGVKSGEMPLSMANGAVYLADFRDRVPEEVETQIAELTEQLIAGEITYTTQYDVE